MNCKDTQMKESLFFKIPVEKEEGNILFSRKSTRNYSVPMQLCHKGY